MSKKVSRVLLKGYPTDRMFDSIKDVRDYFSENRIRCLRCGRRFKGLIGHLWKVHEMTANEYREIYGIPWTYGLVCPKTSSIISDNSTKLIKEGVICTHKVDMAVVCKAQKRPRVVVRDEICTENLSEVNKDCTGEETQRRKAAPKRGTKEHHDKLATRPQCSSSEAKHRLRTIWKGKERFGMRGKMVRNDSHRQHIR